MRTVNEYANEVKRRYIAACEAVLGRGGNVPSRMPMADLPLAISNIPHDTTLAYHTAESTTMRTKVPSNVDKYARINRIGGMTYKCNNLIPLPYADKSKTLNGITFTINDDGSISVSGTATNEMTFYLKTNANPIKNLKGKTITISGGVAASGSYGAVVVNARVVYEDGSTRAFIESPSNRATGTVPECVGVFVGIFIGAGLTVNTTIYPMLNYGETALPYEPYFEGLRNAAVTEIKSEGVNLFDVSQALNENFVDNGDGTYTFTRRGATWEGRFSAYVNIKIPKGVQVTISCNVIAHSENVTSLAIQFLDGKTPEQEVGSNAFSNTLRSIAPKGNVARLRLYLNAGLVEGEYITIANPQITYGYLTEYPYKPYIGEIDKVEIPEAVRNLPDYSCGVKGYPNTVEWREDGRCYYVQRVKSIDMGAYNYGYRFNNNRHIFGLSISDIQGQTNYYAPLNAIAADYNATSVQATWVDRDMAYSASTMGLQRIEIVDNRYTTAAEFKEAVKGKQLIYALAEPIETDITDLMRDNFIAVEGDGNITAVNEHDYDAETSITYLINTVGG